MKHLFKKGHKGYNHKSNSGSFKIGSKINLGKHHSEETRKKISESKKDRIAWNKGIPMTDETKKKLSKIFKGKSNPKNRKLNPITPINKLIRMSIEFRLWREAVFARDNWTCQKCKTKGGKLHPHHIKSFSQFSELRFAIDNGLTLCRECHKKTDNYGKNIK